MLVIILLAVFWYGLVPVIGAFAERKKWRMFRRRFHQINSMPVLDYGDLVSGNSGEYRYDGVYESSGNGILWLRGSGRNPTVMADLRDADIYIFTGRLNMDENSYNPADVPVKLKRNRLEKINGGIKVFIGGSLVSRENRLIFSSVRDSPLLIVFYEGSGKNLPVRAVRAGRHRNEFFNFITPYAFILGAFSQVIIAIAYLSRPAHRVTLIGALIAFFTPLLPWIPPGILLTILYRRLWMQARTVRADRDLAVFRGDIRSTRQYTRKAYILEIISWLLLICGIAVNVFFIIHIIILVQ